MVSVCMATYNGERYIEKQIYSILSQLGKEDELIISDDGSKDATISIIQSFNDKRIKLYFNNKMRGVIGNFENALWKARGKFIFLCDQDDIWMPNKVASILPLLEKNILVVHDAKIVDSEGYVTIDSFFRLRGSKKGYWNNIWRNSYLGCCMCFRSELLPKLLPFPTKIEMHDRWIGLISEIYGNVYFDQEQLICYRVHGRNVSNSTGKSTNSLWQMFMIRFWLVYYSVFRIIRIM